MDSESDHQPDIPRPKRLCTLASSVEFPGRNTLLHQFVLDNSDPNESCSEHCINAVLLCMKDAPSTIVNAPNGQGYTPLHLAVVRNNVLMVRKLFSCLVNIDISVRCEGSGYSSLDHAAKLGHLSVIRELLNKGASVDDANNIGETALCVAARHKQLEAIKLLVSEGANVNHEGFYDTPLLSASRYGNLETVMFLVNSGAYVNVRTAETQRSPLHVAALFNLEVVEYLVRNGADINAKDRRGETPLYGAAVTGRIKILKFLINEGATLDAEDVYGRTPFHEAVDSCKPNLEVIKFLISKGADLNAVDKRGRTPLHCAHNEEIAAILLDRGADVHATDKDGSTPLHDAADRGRAEVVRVLLAKGADRNARNIHGKTPLDISISLDSKFKCTHNNSCIDALQNVPEF